MKKLLHLAGFSMHTNGVPHRRENRPRKGLSKAGRRATLLVSWVLLLALSACSGDFLSSLLSPTAYPATLAVDETETAAPVLPTPTQTTAAVEAVQTLTLWLPPQFDPNSGSDAGNLLRTRLEEFSQQNPDVILQVRIKALSGAGSLIESLTAASAAAPEAVPSLVLLPRSDLETAALKGLVFPLDGLTQMSSDADWYPYARQLATIQGSTFGIPFAGDILLLAYRPAKIGATPTSWTAILERGQPLIFPAGDPQALITLALYQSVGGKVEDQQSRPTLQADTLSQILTLYSNGAHQGIFPAWLTEYQTDGQAWQAYRENRGNWLITWSSRFLSELPVDTTAIPLPALDSDSPSLTSGWVWAVSDPVTQKHAVSVRLAEYLAQSDFLAAWSAAAGYVPPRPSSLAAWSNQNLKALLSQLVLSAQVRPSNYLVSSLGPVLQEAATQVIRNQGDPTQAAEAAAERLNLP